MLRGKAMRDMRIAAAILLLTLISLFPAPALAQEPSPTTGFETPSAIAEPMTIYGTTWVNARPTGRTARAFIGGTECASSDTIFAVDTYVPSYELTVPSAEEKAECGVAGATITFTIDGQAAGETIEWEAGALAYLQLVAGPPFATYSGMFSSPVPLEELGNAMVEPLISGQVCGEQINALQGEGPTWGVSVIVDPAELAPGCGRQGAHVQFRLVRIEDGRRTLLSGVTGDVVWEPGTHELEQVLAFQSPPPQVLPTTGAGMSSAPEQSWRVAFAIGALGVMLVFAGLRFRVGRRSLSI